MPMTELAKPATDAVTHKHVVDQLIEERAQWMLNNPLVWPLIKKLAYPLLGYSRAVALAKELARLTGQGVFDYLSRSLDLQIELHGRGNIPTQGGVVVVANHPTGIADGIVMHDVLSSVRQDNAYFANRDAIRVAPGMADNVIPVEWRTHLRTRADTRDTARQVARVFRANCAVVMFPSGRLARPTLSGLVERPWQSTAVNLARKYSLPILPVQIRGRNSWPFYMLWYVSEPLKDMTLFHELMNKTRARYQVRVGPLVDVTARSRDAEQVTAALSRYVQAGCEGTFQIT